MSEQSKQLRAENIRLRAQNIHLQQHGEIGLRAQNQQGGLPCTSITGSLVPAKPQLRLQILRKDTADYTQSAQSINSIAELYTVIDELEKALNYTTRIYEISANQSVFTDMITRVRDDTALIRKFLATPHQDLTQEIKANVYCRIFGFKNRFPMNIRVNLDIK